MLGLSDGVEEFAQEVFEFGFGEVIAGQECGFKCAFCGAAEFFGGCDGLLEVGDGGAIAGEGDFDEDVVEGHARVELGVGQEAAICGALDVVVAAHFGDFR